MTTIINWLSEKYRGFVTTVTFGGLGHAAEANTVEYIQQSQASLDGVLQYVMWGIAIVTGLLTLVGQCQKQYDRWRQRKGRIAIRPNKRT